ncbi:MAG: ATP-dependent Clp protease ATP-binding subunit, partial [Clostridia bacterium]|nr:ATP-dependent Clp protease ATP-binding subunit [Clostridia bacterium]
DGFLTDSQGRRVDFRNVVIILTSNAGASGPLNGNPLGFASGEKEAVNPQKERMLGALKEIFRPEFLNRIDEVIVFHPLQKQEIEEIAGLMLEEIKKRIAHLGMRISFDDSVRALLAQEGMDPQFGARPLRRAAVKLLEDPFSLELLEGRFQAGDRILSFAKDGKIFFQKESKGEGQS